MQSIYFVLVLFDDSREPAVQSSRELSQDWLDFFKVVLREVSCMGERDDLPLAPQLVEDIVKW